MALVAAITGVLVHRPRPAMVVSSELAPGTPHGCSGCCRRKFSRRWNRQNAAGGRSLSSLAEQGASAGRHHSGLWWRVHVVATGRLAESDPRLVGDEPVMLARQLSCPVVAAPQRIDAARYAVEQFQCTVLVSDDGLSHYALERDAEVVVVDAIRGVGSGLCLPGGPLREPLSRLKEADVVYLNTTSHPTREIGATCHKRCFD